MRSSSRVVLVAVSTLASISCGGGYSDGTTESGSITVFAAASLTDAFDEIAEAFEAEMPDVEVDLSFAGSSSLREQILAGAPAEVFASANIANMDLLAEEGIVSQPATFATNALQIAVPPGNPAGITGLTDFASAELLIGLCASEVPCGELGRQVLRNADVDASLDTNEADVRALITKLEAGELDAGIVYTTDISSAGGGVDGIDIPPALNVTATYSIAVVDHGDEAQSFIDFVLGEQGQAILAEHGFGRP